MKAIKAVVRPTAGEDIICLDVICGSQIETIVCLGKKGNVRLPLGDAMKLRIEDRFKGRLDWPEIEKEISDAISSSKTPD